MKKLSPEYLSISEKVRKKFTNKTLVNVSEIQNKIFHKYFSILQNVQNNKIFSKMFVNILKMQKLLFAKILVTIP